MKLIKASPGDFKTCCRCNKNLGLRKSTPRSDWGYQGKMCKNCFEDSTANSPVFQAEYKEGYSKWEDKMKGSLIVQHFDDRHAILFFPEKLSEKLEIPVATINNHEMVDFQEESTRRRIKTMGLSKNYSSIHLKITFLDDTNSESPIFGLKDVQSAMNAINLLRKGFENASDSKPSSDVVDAIKKATGQNFADESYGKLIDKHGELKKIMKDLEGDETVLFVTRQSRVKPGGSVLTTPNTIFATDKRILIRNPTMLGLRKSVHDISYDTITSVKIEEGVFSATLIFTGPGFGEVNRISKFSMDRSWGRNEDFAIDAIPKKDAHELLKIIKNQMAKAKGAKVSFTHIVNQNAPSESVQIEQDEDPLMILKKRYAKGEISKEEFEDMKSVLE